MPRHAVLLLPGGVLPAELAYAELLQSLGDRVDAVAKDLEIYAGDEPPPDFGLETEVEGAQRSKPEYSLFISSSVAIDTPELPVRPKMSGRISGSSPYSVVESNAVDSLVER